MTERFLDKLFKQVSVGFIWIMLVWLFVSSGGCAFKNSQTGGLKKSDMKKLKALQKNQIASQAQEEKALKKLPPMTASEHEKLGDQYLQQGDISRAFLQYDKALQLDQNQVGIRYKIAMIFVQRSLINEGIRELNEILTIDGNYALAYEGLGLASLQLKENEDAEKFFLQALSLNPDLWRSHNFLGMIYSSRSNFDRSIAEYQKAIALKSDQGLLFNNLGLAYYSQEKYDKAVAAFREALKTESSNGKIYNNLALALSKLGKYDEAFDAFKKAGGEAQAYNNLGCLYLQEGKKDAAISAFEKALQTKSSFYNKASENLRRAQMTKQNESLPDVENDTTHLN
jgi:Flp pilus assembly protein TadD